MAALVRHDTTAISPAIAALGGLRASACFPRMLTTPDYCHHVPGRLRLRFDSLRSNSCVFEALRDDIAAFSGVRSVTANRLTGSIIVEYDPGILPSSDLPEVLRELGIACDASTSGSGEQATAMAPIGRVHGADRLLEWIVERVAVAVIAAVI